MKFWADCIVLEACVDNVNVSFLDFSSFGMKAKKSAINAVAHMPAFSLQLSALFLFPFQTLTSLFHFGSVQLLMTRN